MALNAVCLKALGQTSTDSLYSYIVNSDAESGMRRLEAFQNTELAHADDSVLCDYLYLKGRCYEMDHNAAEAVKWYRASATKADSLRRYNQFFYDAVLKVMLWDCRIEDLREEGAFFGLLAMHTPMSCQEAYPKQYLLYSTLADILNYEMRYADVPEISEKGMYFVKRQFSTADDEYYEIPYTEAVSWCLMGRAEKADSIYNWIESHAVPMSDTLSQGMQLLKKDIQWCKTHSFSDLKQKAVRFIDSKPAALFIENIKSHEGAELAHQFFNLIRGMLADYYYDVSDKEDEMVWNKLLTSQIMYFFIRCDSLPGRNGEAFDNAIIRKDFLTYHTSKLIKKPLKWTDVRDNIKAGDAVIDFSCLPAEAFIIRKTYTMPHSVAIDSLLNDDIVKQLGDEPLVISRLYSADGPLARLWRTLEAELKGVKRLYISGSNEFAQINYGAIPLRGGSVVADRYELHTLLSPSDAGQKEYGLTSAFRTAAVYGGIDYEQSKYNASSQTYADEDWQLTRGLPDNVRGGFDNLPGSLAEAQCADSILRSRHIHDLLYVGKQATEESLKALSGKSPDLLHLSTHGFMLAPLFSGGGTDISDTTHTYYKTVLSQSGLLFAGANRAWRDFKHDNHNDGILTSREIMQLDLSGCKLAILSACRSALGETKNVTGVPFGVAYALKMAGVKQVLCSLWTINDAATSVFMKAFYKHLFAVGNARRALRLTQKEMMTSREYSSPYYWASFEIVE